MTSERHLHVLTQAEFALDDALRLTEQHRGDLDDGFVWVEEYYPDEPVTPAEWDAVIEYLRTTKNDMELSGVKDPGDRIRNTLMAMAAMCSEQRNRPPHLINWKLNVAAWNECHDVYLSMKTD